MIHEKLCEIHSRFKVRSSNLDFFFLHRDVCVWQLQHLHWEFQCNFLNFENIFEIPLTLIKQTCSTRSIWKAQVWTWCGPCFKSVGKQQSSKEELKDGVRLSEKLEDSQDARVT